jgi:hypothetical protein
MDCITVDAYNFIMKTTKEFSQYLTLIFSLAVWYMVLQLCINSY